MSEVNLAALAESGNDRIEAKDPMQQIDLVLKACTFGRFQVQILGAALVALVASVLVSNSTAYLLPNAECDLDMNLVQKGMLNAVPYTGMMFSSLIAGFLTDQFGRKLFLVGGYFGIFFCTLIAATSQTYEVLLTAKFFEGIFFASSFSPTISYTSEFCHKEIRDRVVLCQSSFSAFSQVVIAGLSWAIFTNEWSSSLFGGFIVLHTWNFYLYLMSLWSLTASVLYMLLPESPKFLITQQRYDEARDILIRIYVRNTGKPADTFPFPNIWKSAKQQVIDEAPELKNGSLSHQLMAGLYNVKPMFSMPLVLPLMVISSMGFLSMAVYNVFRLWFPQLSTVVEHYSSTTSNGDLCTMLDAYTEDLRNRTLLDTGANVCVPHPSGAETYINSMIVGTVCFLPYPVTGIVVNKVGKKTLLLVAGVICVCATFGLRWASSKVAVVALFSVEISVSQTIISLLQATTVDVFPTMIRTLAISIVMLIGRIGTLVGNILFPILLDIGCVVPFFGFGGLMIAVTICGLFLPSKKQ